jgi:hypothetical protein
VVDVPSARWRVASETPAKSRPIEPGEPGEPIEMGDEWLVRQRMGALPKIAIRRGFRQRAPFAAASNAGFPVFHIVGAPHVLGGCMTRRVAPSHAPSRPVGTVRGACGKRVQKTAPTAFSIG